MDPRNEFDTSPAKKQRDIRQSGSSPHLRPEGFGGQARSGTAINDMNTPQRCIKKMAKGRQNLVDIGPAIA